MVMIGSIDMLASINSEAVASIANTGAILGARNYNIKVTDPAASHTFSHLSATVVLSRQRASAGLFPAVDPLQSGSKMLTPGIAGERHYRLAQQVRRTLAQYDELKDIIAVLGLVVVNAMKHSPWATSTVFATIPVAVLVGFYMRSWRPGRFFEASVIGGAGSLWGTLIGGIVLGVAQSLGALVSPQGFFIAGHIAFLAVLFARLFFGDVGHRVRTAFAVGARP